LLVIKTIDAFGSDPLKIIFLSIFLKVSKKKDLKNMLFCGDELMKLSHFCLSFIIFTLYMKLNSFN